MAVRTEALSVVASMAVDPKEEVETVVGLTELRLDGPLLRQEGEVHSEEAQTGVGRPVAPLEEPLQPCSDELLPEGQLEPQAGAGRREVRRVGVGQTLEQHLHDRGMQAAAQPVVKQVLGLLQVAVAGHQEAVPGAAAQSR